MSALELYTTGLSSLHQRGLLAAYDLRRGTAIICRLAGHTHLRNDTSIDNPDADLTW